MAQDQVEVMEKLGYREFFVAGHDRGARTTARMCLDHPERVKRAALLDILPNHHIWTHTSKEWAIRSWHWAMMAQPYDFPERMLAGIPAQYFMEKKLSKPGIGLSTFDPEAFAGLVRCFNWKTIVGSCADYRGLPDLRFRHGQGRFRRPEARDATLPLLVLWGARSYTEGVHGDVLGLWQRKLRDQRHRRRPPLRPLRARRGSGGDLAALHAALSGLKACLARAAYCPFCRRINQGGK